MKLWGWQIVGSTAKSVEYSSRSYASFTVKWLSMLYVPQGSRCRSLHVPKILTMKPVWSYAPTGSPTEGKLIGWCLAAVEALNNETGRGWWLASRWSITMVENVEEGRLPTVVESMPGPGTGSVKDCAEAAHAPVSPCSKISRTGWGIIPPVFPYELWLQLWAIGNDDIKFLPQCPYCMTKKCEAIKTFTIVETHVQMNFSKLNQ